MTTSQYVAGLDTHERTTLLALARRPGPRVRADIIRLERDGLVEFVRETRSGTTWYRATALGRRVVQAVLEETTMTTSGWLEIEDGLSVLMRDGAPVRVSARDTDEDPVEGRVGDDDAIARAVEEALDLPERSLQLIGGWQPAEEDQAVCGVEMLEPDPTCVDCGRDVPCDTPPVCDDCVEALRTASAQAGDLAQVAICELAQHGVIDTETAVTPREREELSTRYALSATDIREQRGSTSARAECARVLADAAAQRE